MSAPTPEIVTAEQARRLMLEWACGSRSHWDEFRAYNYSPEQGIRIEVECARADAAETAKWAAVILRDSFPWKRRLNLPETFPPKELI